jgi:hypothetical protein
VRQGEPHHLLESLARRMIDNVKGRFPAVKRVRLELRKLNPPTAPATPLVGGAIRRRIVRRASLPRRRVVQRARAFEQLGEAAAARARGAPAGAVRPAGRCHERRPGSTTGGAGNRGGAGRGDDPGRWNGRRCRHERPARA